jgi:GNAT superfamily N-acetyltransferase
MSSAGDIVTRRAVKADLAAIADLRWCLKKEVSPELSESLREGFVADFMDWSSGVRAEIVHWVAERSGTLVGTMSVIIVEKLPSPMRRDRYGYLTSCFVKEDARNRGLGSRLLAAVKSWPESEGLEMLVVWPSDRAYPFYEEAGFKRSRDPLVLDLKS